MLYILANNFEDMLIIGCLGSTCHRLYSAVMTACHNYTKIFQISRSSE
jgi:hypothetical protein